MYNRDINIIIQSSDYLLENKLKIMLPTDGFNISVMTYRDHGMNVLVKADICIIDIDTAGYIIPTAMTNHKPMLVVFSKQGDVPPDVIKLADELWLNIASDTVLEFYLRKLFELLELKRRLFMSENYLDTLIDNVPDLIWFKKLSGEHIKANKAFCEAVGKSKAEVEGQNHYAIWDIPEEAYIQSDYVCLDTDEVIISTLRAQSFDEKVFTKAGLRQLVTYKAPLFDETNTLVGTMGCAHDVTELKNINKELGTILDSLPFAILVKNEQGLVIDVNEKFMEIFNPGNKSLLGKQYTLSEYLEPGEYCYTKNTDNKDEIHISRAGREYIFSIQKELLYDFFQNPLGNLYIYEDITLEKTVQQKMHELAYADQLTGLYQRRYLYEWSESAELRNLSLLYIDLDNFKRINDNYGHIAGDKTLASFAQILRTIFPQNIVARIGGDEFVVIVEECIKDKIAAKAQCVLDTVCDVFHQDESTKVLSASIGIACVGEEHIQFDALLRKADMALYESKHIGKNCYAFHHSCK